MHEVVPVLGEDRLGVELDAAEVRADHPVHVAGDRVGVDVDAGQVLAAIIGSDAGMSEAVQTLAPGAIVKLSFASARNGDANALTRDRLCHAPGCFISVDVATDLINGRDGLSNITFWIDGEMAKAITSSSRMQQQTQQARERRHAFPGRL